MGARRLSRLAWEARYGEPWVSWTANSRAASAESTEARSNPGWAESEWKHLANDVGKVPPNLAAQAECDR